MSRRIKGGAPGRATHTIGLIVILILILTVFIIASPVETGAKGHDNGLRSITRGKPEGYYNISQISDEYPSIVQRNGTSYDILSSLSLPASRPLYLFSSDTLRFSADASLVLNAPSFFEGTKADPIILSSMSEDSTWKGINIIEADPATTSRITGVEISNAIMGISTTGSDLFLSSSTIFNCERSGVESRGPLVKGTSIDIHDVDIINTGYYGIHLQKISSSKVRSSSIRDCTTGIRVYKSTSLLYDVEIIDSTSLGCFLFESTATISDSVIGSGDGSSTNAQQQITGVNSSIEIIDSTISGGNVCILIIKVSDLMIQGSTISDGFSDCIQAQSSSIYLENAYISEAGESAIHLENSSLESIGSNMVSNGAGSGGLRFSSLYMNESQATLEGGSVMESGYSHFHLKASRMRLKNTTLDEPEEYPVILDEGSSAEYLNIPSPPDPRFMDILSSISNLITVEIEILDYFTGEPISMAQVDITSRDGSLLHSMITGPDGKTEPTIVRTHKNTTFGTTNELPLAIVAMNDTSEISSYSMTYPEREITMELFPPNEPPVLTIISPVNGTEVTDSLHIEGFIYDDLEVYILKYRVEMGDYKTVELDVDPGNSGFFSEIVDLGNPRKGEREIWIHAFDGSHMSAPSIRRVIVTSTDLDDRDNDGIPDILEDINGNGIVDENETDPDNPDTDGDGLLDGIEIDDSDGYTTDPLNEDTDGDFILDGVEDANHNGRVDPGETDPNLWDTDGDGVSDFDDLYPLDSSRWKDPDPGSEGSVTQLILIVVVGVLLILLLFALFQRFGGSPRPGPRDLSKDRTRPEPSKNNTRHRRSSKGNHPGNDIRERTRK